MRKNITSVLLSFCLGIPFASYAQDSTMVEPDTLDAKVILRGEAQAAREQWLRRQLFVENVLTHGSISAVDTTLRFRARPQAPLGLSAAELKNLAPRVDRLDDQFRRDQLGLPPMFNIGELLGKGVKYLTEKLGGGGKANPLAVIPSEVEIEVMNALWKKNQATSAEIFSQLDSTQLSTLTAVDFRQTLEMMADRGLVQRQQISPRHEFTIMGVIPIELSQKNAKNREFLYRPKVSRQTMFSFLDATAFSYRLTAAESNSLIRDHLRKLMHRLAIKEN